jgi:hypothetical protein
VAEVKFAEWTSKGELRQPVYLGLRSDSRRRTSCANENDRGKNEPPIGLNRMRQENAGAYREARSCGQP